MCTVSIDIDEATMQQIAPDLKSHESIRRWLQHQVDLMLEEMTASNDLAENRRLALERDMTPEQLYSVVLEEIEDIYAN
jgi:hypothetical protein